MTEMEADLQKAEIEANTKIKVAKIEADAKVAVAKHERKRAFWGQIYLNGVIAGILGLVLVLGGVGAIVYQHVNNAKYHNQQVEQCVSSGGTWTPKIQRVYPGSGNERDEWYEVCVKP